VPQVDVDDTLLAEESFREMLAALDFRATFEPARNELRMRATLAPELLPVNGDGRVVPSVNALGRTRTGWSAPTQGWAGRGLSLSRSGSLDEPLM